MKLGSILDPILLALVGRWINKEIRWIGIEVLHLKKSNKYIYIEYININSKLQSFPLLVFAL